MEGHHEYYNMETQKCEFHKIKVQKRGKIRPWEGTFRGYILGSVAVHFRCSLSTMEATSLPAPAE